MYKEKATLRRSTVGGRHGVKIVFFFSFSAPQVLQRDHDHVNTMASLWPWPRDPLDAMINALGPFTEEQKRSREEKK